MLCLGQVSHFEHMMFLSGGLSVVLLTKVFVCSLINT